MVEPRPGQLRAVARYVEDVSGVVLDESKGYLVRTRLGPLLRETCLGSYEDLVRRAERETDGRLRERIIDAITTNETSFFRDGKPFQLLVHKLVPERLEQQTRAPGGRPCLSVWSAACSTGQEVHSIAIALQELLGDLGRYRIRVLGTEISRAALEAASRGRYSAVEMSRGLSELRRGRHFLTDGGDWTVSDELRGAVTFRPLNLLAPFRHLGSFDIVFCRYVAIYFSAAQRIDLFRRLGEQLRPGGALIVGATEALDRSVGAFEREEYHGAVFYRRRSQADPASAEGRATVPRGAESGDRRRYPSWCATPASRWEVG